MQFLNGKLLFSASDLVNFLGCRHSIYLDLRDLAKPVQIPPRDAATVLIFEKGLEHERRYLASLKEQGTAVVEIPSEGFDVPERTYARLFAASLRRTHGIARDADDAVLLAEEVQRLDGLFGEADNSAWGEHESPRAISLAAGEFYFGGLQAPPV